MSTQTNQQVQDLCSHQILLQKYNHLLHADTSQSTKEIIKNFDEMIELMKFIIQEKAKFIVKSESVRIDQIHCMVFGSEYNIGLINFIDQSILNTKQCQEYVQYCQNIDDNQNFDQAEFQNVIQDTFFQKMYHSTNIDYVIRARFMRRVQSRIEIKIIEYAYQVAQILICDYQELFCRKEQSDEFNYKKSYITLLRFLDCLTWDRQSLEDEDVLITSSKIADTIKVIREIASQSDDLQTIKLSATVLTASHKAWSIQPVTKDLFVKNLTISEVGQALILSENQELAIQDMQKRLAFTIDFEPYKVGKEDESQVQKSQWIIPSENLKDGSPLDLIDQEQEESSKFLGKQYQDDLLACYTRLNQIKDQEQNKDQEMQIDQQNEKITRKLKEKLIISIVLNFENGISTFVENIKKELLEQEMQIDKNQKVISLKNVAEHIFEKAYKQKYDQIMNELKDQKDIKQRIQEYQAYKENQANYDSIISYIEASLMIQMSIKDLDSLKLALECSIESVKLINKRDSQMKSPLNNISERVKLVLSSNINKICRFLVEKSNSIESLRGYMIDQLTHNNLTIGYFNVFNNLLRNMKNQPQKNKQATLQPIIDFIQSKNKEQKSFLIELLTQMSNIQIQNVQNEYKNVIAQQTITDSDQIDSNQIPSDFNQQQKVLNICDSLLLDHRFQIQLWNISQSIYLIICASIKSDRPGVSLLTQELQQLFQQTKKDFENVAQKILLKDLVPLNDQNESLFVHNTQVLIQISKVFIRSAWITEGMSNNQNAGQNEGVQRSDENLQKIIKLICNLIRACEHQNYYLIEPIKKKNPYKMPINMNDIIKVIYQLVRKLTMENRGPAQPEQYFQTLLSSELFSQNVFGKLNEQSINVDNLLAGQQAQSNDFNQIVFKSIKNVIFYQLLSKICYNEPALISKIIENGLLKQVIDSILYEGIPVINQSFCYVFDFIKIIAITEKGKQFIKDMNIFEKIVMPQITSSAEIQHQENKNYITTTLITSIKEMNRHIAMKPFAELIRANDTYFMEKGRSAVTQIIKTIKTMALALQAIYYKRLREYTQTSGSFDEFTVKNRFSMSYRQFLVQVTEEISSQVEYYIIKFELEKLFQLMYTTHHEGGSAIKQIQQFFHPSMEAYYEIFEILTTIKPVFEYQNRIEDQHGYPQGIFYCMKQIFHVMVYSGENGQPNDSIKIFEKKFKGAIQNFKDIIVQAEKSFNPENVNADIANINFLKILGQCDIGRENKVKIKEQLKSINETNIRGHIIGQLLIVCQYCKIFEGVRRDTQHAMLIHSQWHNEITDLTNIQSLFIKSSVYVTNWFFEDHQNFLDMRIVTQQQLDQLFIKYKKGISIVDKEKFEKNRRTVEENLDLYRENLTYIDMEYSSINRLRSHIWEYWRSRGNDTKDNRKTYQKVAIQKLIDSDIKDTIKNLQNSQQDLNSNRFLADISHVYSYVSHLSSMISKEELQGYGFYSFVRNDSFNDLLNVFNFLKSLKLKKYMQHEPGQESQLKLLVVDCIQSICSIIKNIFNQLLQCSPSLTQFQKPSLEEIIIEDDIYDSVQDFYVNFLYKLTKGITSRTEQKNQSSLIDDSEENSQSNNLDFKMTQNLYENKELRKIQVLFLNAISSRFSKFKYLKNEYSNKISKNNQKKPGPESARKPPHRDLEMITQIVAMGFDPKEARKALKMTGDLQQAVSLLINQDFEPIAGVSDSEDREEKEKLAQQNKKPVEKEQTEQQKAQKKLEEEKQELRKQKINFEDFNKALNKVINQGQEIVTLWSTFSVEDSKRVPYKKQQKYLKLYETYVMNRVQFFNVNGSNSEEQKNDKITDVCDDLMKKYFENIDKITEILTVKQLPHGAYQQIQVFQETKNKLSLIQKLFKQDSIKQYLRAHKNNEFLNPIQVFKKVIDSVWLIVSKPKASDLLFQDQQKNLEQVDFFMQQIQNESYQTKYIYLSVLLEFLFRNLQLFLVYEQSLISKKGKTKFEIKELNKKEKLANKEPNNMFANPNADIKKKQNKIKEIEKEFKILNGQELAQISILFVKQLKKFINDLSGKNDNFESNLKISEKEACDLNEIVAQIVDLSRIIYIQDISYDAKDELKKPLNNENYQKNNTKLDLQLISQGSQIQTTIATTTLNILQVQKEVFDENVVEDQLKYISQTMLVYKAKKIAQYQKNKEKKSDDIEDDAKISDQKLQITQQQTQQSIIEFSQEFQRQILGIGKTQLPPNQQNQFQRNPPSQTQVNLSFPSNEYANKIFNNIMMNAIPKCCDIIVKGDANKDNLKSNAKPQDIKKTTETCKIQLKKEIIESINKGEDFKQENQLFCQNAQIYEQIFNQLKDSTFVWENDLKQFMNLQKDQKENQILQIVEQNEEINVALDQKSFENWQTLSMVALRNISSLSRVYFHNKSDFIQSIINDINQSPNQKSENILDWIIDVYFPLRVLKRTCTYSETQKKQQSKAAKQRERKVQYSLENNINLELLDKNICLFLNELTGFGHIYSEDSKNQRIILRAYLIQQCLNSLYQTSLQIRQSIALSLLQQAKILTCIIIIQHLINQFNNYEFNRVLLSRECYQDSIKLLFSWQTKESQNIKPVKFLSLYNNILSVLSKQSISSQKQQDAKADSKNSQSFPTLVIERMIKTFTTISLFLEGEKKREQKLKEDAKIKREKQKLKQLDKNNLKGDEIANKKNEDGIVLDNNVNDAEINNNQDIFMQNDNSDVEDDDINGEGQQQIQNQEINFIQNNAAQNVINGNNNINDDSENDDDDDDDGQDDEDNDDYGDDEEAVGNEENSNEGFAILQDNIAQFNEVEFSSFLPEQANHMTVQNGCLTLTDQCYLWSDESFNIEERMDVIFSHKGQLNVMFGPEKEAWSENNQDLQSISFRIENGNKLWVRRGLFREQIDFVENVINEDNNAFRDFKFKFANHRIQLHVQNHLIYTCDHPEEWNEIRIGLFSFGAEDRTSFKNVIIEDSDDQDDMDEDEDNQDNMGQRDGANVFGDQILMVHDDDQDELEEDEGEMEIVGPNHHDVDYEIDEDDDDDQEFDDFEEIDGEEDDDFHLRLPVGGLFQRYNRARELQNNQRDILFRSQNPPGPGAGHHFVFERILDNPLQFRLADQNNQNNNYGQNWSREEEEVSQILRNLRGLQQQQVAEPEPRPLFGGGVLNPNQLKLQNLQNQSHRYSIEFDICPQFNTLEQLEKESNQPKKTIEQIKQEQLKPQNNHISTVFQIIKPLSLHQLCIIAQQIEQSFQKSQIQLDNRRIEWENESKLNEQDQIVQSGYFDDDSDQEFPELFSLSLIDQPQNYMPGMSISALSRVFQHERALGEREQLIERIDNERLFSDHLQRVQMDIQRLLQDQMAMPFDNIMGDNEILNVFGNNRLQREREHQRVEAANANRDAQNQAANWEQQLYRQPEAPVNEIAANMIQELVENQQVVYEEDQAEPQPQSNNNLLPESQDNRRNQLEEIVLNQVNEIFDSQSNIEEQEMYRRRSVNLQEEQKVNEVQNQQPGFNELNQNMANLQVNNDQAQQNQQLESQQMLNQFFSSIVQNQEQPVQNVLQQPDQNIQQQEELKQEEDAQVAQQQNNNESNNSSSLIGGMGGLNRALDEIRNDLMQIPNEIERIIQNSQMENNLQQPEGAQIGSSLIEQVEDNIQQLSIQQIPEQPVQQVQGNEEQVEMTYGFPNSLLIANDIEPSMLNEIPEDMRNELLDSIRDQLEEWQANQGILRQQNQQQVEQLPIQNVQNPPPENQLPAQDNLQQLEQNQQQNQELNQPQAQVQQPIVIPAQQEVQDPLIAQAIAMGIDPEFVANLPPEMLRELIQNDQFRAENLGVPQQVQQQPPGRGPEEIDVASIIASTQDPGLRREMLLNLSIEQTNILPAALRTEALNLRRGRLPDGLLHQDLRAGGPIRFDRDRARRDAPGDRPRNHDDFIERQMEMFMNRIRGENDHLDPYNPINFKSLAQVDPSKKQFDEIVVNITQELDQECQDKNLLVSQKNLKIINMIQEQLVEDSFLTPLNDLREIGESEQEDRLLKNILLTVCLNHNIKTDVVQFLRLIMKNKTEFSPNNQVLDRKTSQSALSTTYDTQQSYQFRNKIINTLTYVLQIASNQDFKSLLSLFEIHVSHDQLSQIVMSSYQWNRIFLTVTGVLRVLIDSNKKLILHMLKSLIQRDDYFVSKGDHVISSHAKILLEQKMISPSNQIDSSSQFNVKPPLAIIIQIMRDQSEQYHNLNRQNDDQTEELVNNRKERIIRVRNIKLLIQDIIKQFDLLFEDISSNQQQKLQNPQFSINLGEMSLESVQSLTDLLYLPFIDKKLLTVLSDFIYRMSDLCLVSAQSKKVSSTWQKDFDNSKRNFMMISKQCETIGSKNLNTINLILNQILMVFGSFDIHAMQNQSMSKNLSNIDRQNSQISDSHRITDSYNKEISQNNQQRKKLNQECEKQVQELFNQFKQDCSPFLHVLSLKSYLFQKLFKDKQKYNNCISTLVQHIEDADVEVLKLQEDAEKNKSSIEKKNKDKEEYQQTIKQYETLIQQKEDFLIETKAFYKDELIQILINQISQILVIAQQTDMQLNESIKILLNCAFDCFMPEMQDEVIRKQQENLVVNQKKKNGKEESESYVLMESIKKIYLEEELGSSLIVNQQSSLVTPNKVDSNVGKQISESNSKMLKNNRIIFRNVDEFASDRLLTFNMFCLQNKDLLNKIVKDLFNNNQIGQPEGESHLKELSTVSEFIKYMPNLLDFENKRQYFKKEIKKLRKQSNSRQLHLSIRRKEIFMDAYSQLNHLTTKELKGKIKIDFAGERGMDVGGLTRDFFIELSKEMFNPNYSLFTKSANGSTYMPNQKSYVHPDHIRFFKFIGRVIGKALFEGCLLECYFVKSIYKMLIGQKLNFRDLEDFDNDLYVGLNWCLQPQSDVEALYETFSITVDYFGKTEVIDLIPNGRNIDVTSENKYNYVESKAYHQLYKSVQKQIDAFLEGFYEIIPRDLISIFTYKELELLISGMPDFKISDLKQHTNYNGYNANSPQIIWFWEIMETLDRTEKGNFLQFVTGSSKVPVEGFQSLQGMNGPEKFQITRILAKDCMRLPQGHTCFNQLDLPEYPSKEILHERLMWAIKETSGFGFA